jgi:hypothetical protein
MNIEKKEKKLRDKYPFLNTKLSRLEYLEALQLGAKQSFINKLGVALAEEGIVFQTDVEDYMISEYYKYIPYGFQYYIAPYVSLELHPQIDGKDKIIIVNEATKYLGWLDDNDRFDNVFSMSDLKLWLEITEIKHKDLMLNPNPKINVVLISE